MRKILAAAAFAALAACTPAKKPEAAATPAAIAQASQDLNAYLDVEYEKELQFSPENLTSQGRKEQYDKLDDRTDAGDDRELAWRRQSVADMKAKFDPNKLDEEARTSFEVWADALDRDELRNKYRRYRYIASQQGGPHTGLPQFLITQHAVDSKVDMEAYIARVGLIGTALDQSLEGAKASAAMNIRMPRFVYPKASAEAKALITGAPFGKGRDSALFADGKAKIAQLQKDTKITAAEARRLTDDLAKAMTEKMKPSYEHLIAWLKEDEANTTLDAKGAGALPAGAEYYDAALKLQTTTDMTADEIHQLGLSEVARIHKEMEAIKEKVVSTARCSTSSRICGRTRSSSCPTPTPAAPTISRWPTTTSKR